MEAITTPRITQHIIIMIFFWILSKKIHDRGHPVQQIEGRGKHVREYHPEKKNNPQNNINNENKMQNHMKNHQTMCSISFVSSPACPSNVLSYISYNSWRFGCKIRHLFFFIPLSSSQVPYNFLSSSSWHPLLTYCIK